MKFKRLQNWPIALDAYIAQRRRMPFAWGKHDCCQFARRAVQAMTGKDPARGWKLPRYQSATGAARVLQKLGGTAALPGKAGLEEVPVAMARRGDLMTYQEAGVDILGVCLGQHTAGPAKDGLAFTPTLSCRKAWRL